ncbi:MAG: flagellar filament capping protein FliD [Lachnospiraceae bacterium]|nr:flagellar filament capping protein FliD [Lachnospiraceae bacterium]
MANSIQNEQVYNHFLTAYAPKEFTRADTHKKDELRNIYNSIVKLSKESPLYLLTNDSAMEADAVGIKESARGFQGMLADMEDDSENALFAKKSAYTTDSTMVSASYIGGDRALEDVPSFQIEVEKLATQQKNTGRYLPQDEPAGLAPGAYSFNVRVGDLNYEFQYSVRSGDSNYDIQERLGRLINKSNIGLSAEVSRNEGWSALSITSNDYGIPLGREERFTFSEQGDGELRTGTIGYFGLDRNEIPAANAEFSLDGKTRTSTSNHFTVASMYELQLLKTRGEDDPPVTVGVKDDNASLIDRTRELVGGYNAFLDSVKGFRNDHFKANRVTNEVTGIAKQYYPALNSLGINITEDGHIDLDVEALTRSASSSDVRNDFRPIKEFAGALQEKMDQIVLDPMHYIERPVVAYKNPGHGFPNPYITSEYSGMMFNGYC